MGILWHPHSRTIILPQERLALQGWPVFESLQTIAGLAPFHFPDLAHATKYAGNAYNVAVYGLWWLTCLACIQKI